MNENTPNGIIDPSQIFHPDLIRMDVQTKIIVEAKKGKKVVEQTLMIEDPLGSGPDSELSLLFLEHATKNLFVEASYEGRTKESLTPMASYFQWLSRRSKTTSRSKKDVKELIGRTAGRLIRTE